MLNFEGIHPPKKGWIEIKTFKQQPLYNDQDLQKYKQNILCHDVGSYLFMKYIQEKYKDVYTGVGCNPLDPMTVSDLDDLDHGMYQKSNPRYLIYYGQGDLYFDPSLLENAIQNPWSCFIVSHSQIYQEGHLAALFVVEGKVYYYDCNGVEDRTYYFPFEKKLMEVCQRYHLEYVPSQCYVGIQNSQGLEASKYNFSLNGLCSSWTYYMIEQVLKSRSIDFHDLEAKVRKRYRYYLTRMIGTYSFHLHQALWKRI
jgi:hypothetical protein